MNSSFLSLDLNSYQFLKWGPQKRCQNIPIAQAYISLSFLSLHLDSYHFLEWGPQKRCQNILIARAYIRSSFFQTNPSLIFRLLYPKNGEMAIGTTLERLLGRKRVRHV